MRVAMYHYVRGETSRPPSGYYHLDIEDFRAQLDHFERAYTLLSRETFRACLRGDRAPPDDGLVLTFDDGLADHYEWVLPELRARDRWGVFFVPTAPLTFDRRLPVHRIHALVSEYPGSELLTALMDILRTEPIELDSDAGDMYAGRETANDVRRFKHLLNRAVPDHSLAGVLDRLEARFPDARTTVEELYLTPAQLRELAGAGMLIGAHSVTHPVLSDLPVEAQRWEIAASRRHLSQLVDAPVDLFAYPYGGGDSYTGRTVDLVRSAGFEAAFTTEAGDVSADGGHSLTLPRRDCAALEHGDSTFSLPGTG